jgi:hypothetical protein
MVTLRRSIVLQCFSVLALVMLPACTTTNQRSAADFVLPKKDAKILILEPNADMALVSAGGVREARADWTETAKANLLASFTSEFKEKNVAVVMQDAAKPIDGQLQQLSETVMMTAIVHGPGYGAATLPTKEDKFDFTLGKDSVAELGSNYDADYAMFVYSYGNFASAGNIAMQVVLPLLFGQVAVPQTQQVSTLISLVDLKDGDLVWIDQRFAGDIRQPEPAAALVDALVQRMPVEGTKTAPKPAKTEAPARAATPPEMPEAAPPSAPDPSPVPGATP